MQSTPKREITRNKYWSHRTPPEAQIFSESNISIKLFEDKDWLVYENAKTVFNFCQILCNTSCTYIIFTVIKRHNPGRCGNTLWRSVNHLRNLWPTVLRCWAVRQRRALVYWTSPVRKHHRCDVAEYILHVCLCSPTSCARTRAAGVALWAGCLCGWSRFLLPDHFPHFLGWEISVKKLLWT